MASDDQPSAKFLEWQRAPESSVAGAVLGLVLAWTVGGYLFLSMVEIGPIEATVSATELLLWMAGPLAVGSVACVVRRVRYWAGAFVPGVISGWFLGCLTFVLLALLSLAG